MRLTEQQATRVRAEVWSRAQSELERRRRIKAAMLAELFDRQLGVINDSARYLAVCCSRRAGKSHVLARLIALALMDAGRNEWVAFCAVTLEAARRIIWSELVHLNEKHGFGWIMSKQHGTIETRAGAHCLLIGISETKSAEKLRGPKYHLVVCDESATYDNYLKNLITEVIDPALMDLRGRLILSGTPGYVLAGPWWKAATQDGTRYSRHHWTFRDNPHIPDPESYLAEQRAENHWTEDDPVYVREYLGEWRADDSATVYAFTRDRNSVRALPEPFSPETWLVTMGMDFGMSDDCAWVVLGSPYRSRDVFVLHAEKAPGLLPSQAAATTARLVDTFKPARVVGDASGKVYIEEWNRRHGAESKAYIHAADKHEKVANIALLNGALRGGGVKLFLPAAEPLALEIETLPWYDANRTKEHPGFPNHCGDSLLYAWRSHRAYLHEVPPEAKSEEAQKRDTYARERDERLARQRGRAGLR